MSTFLEKLIEKSREEKKRKDKEKEKEKIRKDMAEIPRSDSPPVKVVIPVDCPDEVTCRRVGVFCAYGMTDQAIINALLLSNEQLILAKQTDWYHSSYAQKTGEKLQRQIDLEEGWDVVEEKALAEVFQSLQYQGDPKYALQAAVFANKATRRSPSGGGKVIDATKTGNVIVLTLNQKFIQSNTTEEGRASLDLSQGERTNLSRKLHDIPPPKKVSDLLGVKQLYAPVGSEKKQTKSAIQSEIEEFAEMAGISKDLLPE